MFLLNKFTSRLEKSEKDSGSHIQSDSSLKQGVEEIPKTEEEFCSNCLEQGKKEPRTVFCENCNNVYCEECNQSIHSISVFAKHKRMSAVEDRVYKKIVRAWTCNAHKGRYELFCLTCDEFLCAKCAISQEHKPHKICNLEEALKKEENVPDRQIVIAKTQSELKDIREKSDLLASVKARGLKDINQRCEELISILEAQRDILLKSFTAKVDRHISFQMAAEKEKQEALEMLEKTEKIIDTAEKADATFIKIFQSRLFKQIYSEHPPKKEESCCFSFSFVTEKQAHLLEDLAQHMIILRETDIVTNMRLNHDMTVFCSSDKGGWKYAYLDCVLKPGSGRFSWETTLLKAPAGPDSTKFLVGVIEKDLIPKVGASPHNYGWNYLGTGKRKSTNTSQGDFHKEVAIEEGMVLKIDVDLTSPSEGKMYLSINKKHIGLVHADLNRDIFPWVACFENKQFKFSPFGNFSIL